jgi:hypothetical protein
MIGLTIWVTQKKERIMKKLKNCVISVLVVLALVALTGCGPNVCKDEVSICPSGVVQPSPDASAYCVYEPMTESCGGCVNYTRMFGRTECYDRSTGACASDCADACLECHVVYFKAGALCVQFRQDPAGCVNENCDYYVSAVYY